MPTISMFYGIIVSIYYAEGDRHHTPHIHIRHQGNKAVISLIDGTLLAGDMPQRQLRMVLAWIEIHRDALLADWELVTQGEAPFHIDPLR